MRAMFDVNVFGLVDITNRVVPMMKEQGTATSSIRVDVRHEGRRDGTAYGGSNGRCAASANAGRRSFGRMAFGWFASVRRRCRRTSADAAGATTRTSSTPRHRRHDHGGAGYAARALWPELAVFANNPWKEMIATRAVTRWTMVGYPV